MRKVFIGSSSEAVRYVEKICGILGALPNIKPVPWTEIFDPGTLTFEAIEKVAREVAGAVLLATPDDDSTIRDHQVKVPRTNVMIEFGYLTAALGRPRIALCKYSGVELATDLGGFTYVAMGAYQGHQGSQEINAEAVKQLTRWAQALPDAAEGVPLTSFVHGYTGRWKVKMKFTKWRFVPIAAPGYADLEGFLDLSLGAAGRNGLGFLHGNLYASVNKVYSDIHFGAQVENAYCDALGMLHLMSVMHSRQAMTPAGEPETQPGVEPFRGPRHGEWELKPVPGQAGRLAGTFTVKAGDQTSDVAECALEKLSI